MKKASDDTPADSIPTSPVRGYVGRWNRAHPAPQLPVLDPQELVGRQVQIPSGRLLTIYGVTFEPGDTQISLKVS